MRLSDAIRAGARLKPQGRGAHSGFTKAPRTCAIGAAAAGIGMVTEDFVTTLERLMKLYPNYSRSVFKEIWWMNDVRGLSRDEIADWIQRLEEEHLGSAR